MLLSRIFYRCVDWNSPVLKYQYLPKGRIFYRCVDWNYAVFNIRHSSDVASFTDAWIETRVIIVNVGSLKPLSHLLQMRGLKQGAAYAKTLAESRIFYRCVDWNLGIVSRNKVHIVASFTDAWIETPSYAQIELNWLVASFTDAWIETTGSKVWWRSAYVASFTDAWIETWSCKCYLSIIEVASFTDAWIETVMSRLKDAGLSRIFYRCVDWNHSSKARLNVSLMSHPLRGQLFIIFFARRLQD